MSLSFKIKSLSFFSSKELVQLFSEKINNFQAGPLTTSRVLIQKLLEADYRVLRRKDAVRLEAYSGSNFILRKNSSDGKVFKQIWIQEEYKPVLQVLKDNKIDVRTIIDCGANVGYSLLFFSKHFPEAKIVAVEPDRGNANVINENLAANTITNCTVITKGIWHRSAYLKISTSFRDGANWSFSLEETTDQNTADTEAVSIQSLVNEFSFDTIDLLKIDIEGAERYIFQNYEYASGFLSKTKCLVIEIHDEFNIRSKIYEILHTAGFEWIETGDITIAVRRR